MEENHQPLKANFKKKKTNTYFWRQHPSWDYAQLKLFPGGTSKELLYYVEPTLKSKKFDPALLYVGVNDLLNDESQDSVQNLGLKCKSAGVKRILISGIAVNNKLTSAYISSVNQRISNMCRENSFVSIDNNNIPT